MPPKDILKETPLLDAGVIIDSSDGGDVSNPDVMDAGNGQNANDVDGGANIEISPDAGIEELICPIAVGGYCTGDSECDDTIDCTSDFCNDDGICTHTLSSSCNDVGRCASAYGITLNPQWQREAVEVPFSEFKLIEFPGDFDGCISAPGGEQFYLKLKLENAGFVRFSAQNPIGFHQLNLKMANSCPSGGGMGGPPGGSGPNFIPPPLDGGTGANTDGDGMVFYCNPWDPPPDGYNGGDCRETTVEVDGGTVEVSPCERGLECVTAHNRCVGPDVNCEFYYLGQKRFANIHLQAGDYYLGVVQFASGGSQNFCDIEVAALSLTALEILPLTEGIMNFSQERQLWLGGTFADNSRGFLPPAVFTWTSSNPQVALLVDETPGLIRAGVPGTATITAEYTDAYGGASATYVLVVE